LTSWVRPVIVGAVLAVLAVCGFFEAAMAPFGLESSVVTFAVAAGTLGLSAALQSWPSIGLDQPVSRPLTSTDSSLRSWGTFAWVLAGGLVLAVELWELFHSPRSAYPTLSSLANYVIGPGHRLGRASGFVCWALCGLVVSSRPGPRT
jgi:hypothetical protein